MSDIPKTTHPPSAADAARALIRARVALGNRADHELGVDLAPGSAWNSVLRDVINDVIEALPGKEQVDFIMAVHNAVIGWCKANDAKGAAVAGVIGLSLSVEMKDILGAFNAKYPAPKSPPDRPAT